MTTLTRIIATSIISALLLSCNFTTGVEGNGNVVKANRTINQNINEIKISNGLDLYITQSNNQTLSIETDENLQNLIITEVVDGTLNIYTSENIGRATLKKVMLDIKTISKITATSGSDVFSNNTVKVSNLELNSTSGADIKLNVLTESLSCNSTSGSDIDVSGSTVKLVASATSGSYIDASQLIAEIADVSVTSGADINVNTTKILTAQATSGGDVKYLGNPETINKSDNSAGSIKRY
ncbi:head GIN domain-containing protein [Winogradskyella wichelsiae]|uniref:head GIN domain-containing protein n=1 Tax=Winogradskyella wichelsiae TaxID=2697007 RepID=UPI003EF3ABA2